MRQTAWQARIPGYRIMGDGNERRCRVRGYFEDEGTSLQHRIDMVANRVSVVSLAAVIVALLS
jgi:hypothetical protein